MKNSARKKTPSELNANLKEKITAKKKKVKMFANLVSHSSDMWGALVLTCPGVCET